MGSVTHRYFPSLCTWGPLAYISAAHTTYVTTANPQRTVKVDSLQSVHFLWWFEWQRLIHLHSWAPVGEFGRSGLVRGSPSLKAGFESLKTCTISSCSETSRHAFTLLSWTHPLGTISQNKPSLSSLRCCWSWCFVKKPEK